MELSLRCPELCWESHSQLSLNQAKWKCPCPWRWAEHRATLCPQALSQCYVSDYMLHQDRPWVGKPWLCDLRFDTLSLWALVTIWRLGNLINWFSTGYLSKASPLYMHVLSCTLSLPHHPVLLSSIRFLFCPSNCVLERSWGSPLKPPSLPRLASGDPPLTYRVPSVKIVSSPSSGFVAPSYPVL